jgi:hypothetical protein
MSSCGRRSPARWRTGPRRSAASRDRLAAPAAAPVATCSATITAAGLADARAGAQAAPGDKARASKRLEPQS